MDKVKCEKSRTISFLGNHNNNNNQNLDVLTHALTLCHVPCTTCTLPHYFLYQVYVVDTVTTLITQRRKFKDRVSK